ncbi:MAG: hypothetical protein WBB01_13615 [Phormidesmis sp.]
MSDPVLSQLVAVEDDLAQQVETLETRLNQLQEQRQGLRTVIGMFQGSENEGEDVSTIESPPAEPIAKEPEPIAEEPEPVAEEPASAPKAKARAGRKPKASTAKTPAKTKTTRRKKKDGRAATWQKYVQSDYRETALPEAVSSVLRSQPSEIFTIADVMSSIFSEDMPRTSYLKARNRISNILSAGARDGTWYRGRNGRYSQSESVTKAK